MTLFTSEIEKIITLSCQSIENENFEAWNKTNVTINFSIA